MGSLRIDSNDLRRGLEKLAGGPGDIFQMYAETVAKDFETYAKSNRPWNDRTSRARQGLTGYVRKIEKGYRIVIAHTVDYGLFLEMARNKKYAILEPTVRLKGAEAIKGMEHLLELVRNG